MTVPGFPMEGLHSRIVYEREEFLVVNKAPHVHTHPSKPTHKKTLWHELQHLLAYECTVGGQVSIVTRLDRETSGLVLVAKTRMAARRFGLLMEQRRIAKEYLALVMGHPDWTTVTCRAPLLRKASRMPSPIWLKRAVHPDGEEAITRCRCLRKFTHPVGGKLALIQAEPLTGRTHQIRVHLAHLGTPILGDKIYGPDETCYLDFVERGWSEELGRRLLHDRHALHASRLRIPLIGLDCRAAWPEDLQQWLARRA